MDANPADQRTSEIGVLGLQVGFGVDLGFRVQGLGLRVVISGCGKASELVVSPT